MEKNLTSKNQKNASVTEGSWGLKPGFTQVMRVSTTHQQGSRIGKQRVIFGRVR